MLGNTFLRSHATSEDGRRARIVDDLLARCRDELRLAEADAKGGVRGRFKPHPLNSALKWPREHSGVVAKWTIVVDSMGENLLGGGLGEVLIEFGDGRVLIFGEDGFALLIVGGV